MKDDFRQSLYSLESPQRGDSNGYPQHMFLRRSKQNYPLIITKYPSYLFHCQNASLCLYISDISHVKDLTSVVLCHHHFQILKIEKQRNALKLLSDKGLDEAHDAIKRGMSLEDAASTFHVSLYSLRKKVDIEELLLFEVETYRILLHYYTTILLQQPLS